jgi:hypothetical protein
MAYVLCSFPMDRVSFGLLDKGGTIEDFDRSPLIGRAPPGPLPSQCADKQMYGAR